ncbi:glycoside hydrolase family 31 protein [Paenibacillus sp. NFR01]|uniref:glycoside hydrolase family 31 protein n=1 Tax=Paenibacillus sp. NFR01 TaxID=1566279 RepID=UPI0008B136D8|nr:glycoside hydrolase family 31 protein [Paenibacillus sp. NFR01]SEU23654.1 alpha-glucosidase [Paenibacillus sp. NFR01]
MQNSLAIHPDHFRQVQNDGFTDIGSLLDYESGGNTFRLHCQNGEVTAVFYNASTLRVTMNPDGEAELGRNSHVLIPGPEETDVRVEDAEDRLLLETNSMTVVVSKNPCRITLLDRATGKAMAAETERGMMYNARGEVACFKAMDADDHFYGFGEKAGFLDKRGEKMTMWNTDVYAPHNQETDPLYVSVPFFMGLREGKAYGIFFFNTFRTVLNLTGEQEYFFWAEGGQLDYFLFAGPGPKEVIGQYTALTGRIPLPPKWAIGYHQSRYSYQSEAEVRELVASYQQKQIPLDAIHLDIHYMNGYRVFTFDKSRFPAAGRLIRELKEAGIRIVPIVDPGVKADPEYGVFKQGIAQGAFCRKMDGSVFYGQVWPEKSAFPDFSEKDVRRWWGSLHRYYTNLGIEGIWNDMNEPSVFNDSKTMDLDVVHGNDGQPATHRELHNLYGYLMSKATYEGMKEEMDNKRPFVLTRAGYAGIQRYAAVWTGDNRSFWEHLEMSMPMCMNMGLSGIAFCGADVGGFAHDSNGQLLVRWTQLGALMPYFRNHSELKSIRQEPWAFGPAIEALVKRYITLRYQWLPYLYGLFREASLTGIPLMRPLLLEYPQDVNTYNLNDQFMLGSQVLVAPVTRPDTNVRAVYLPVGRWFDYWTDQVLEGGRHVLVQAPLDVLPIYVKEGAILPHVPGRLTTGEPEEELVLHVYLPQPGADAAEYTLYEDDGGSFDYSRGALYEQRITAALSEPLTLDIRAEIICGGYAPSWKRKTIIVHGAPAGLEVKVDGVAAALREPELPGLAGRIAVEWE